VIERSRPSVLVVDDQPKNLVALKAVLKPLDLNVVTAGSGEEALRLLLDEEYAVILLDVQMPGMDGFETAEFIKRRDKTAHIPIIFLTAISKEEQHVFRGYAVGAVDYVFKPFDPDILRSKVATFVDLFEKSAALRTSEERFRTAFANAPIGIALVGPDGHWLQANQALTELLGYAQHELFEHPLWELSHPDDRAATETELKGVLAGEVGLFQGEKRLVHKEGHAVHVMLNASLARRADGGALNYIVQFVDVTERWRATREQAARAEAEAVADTIQKIQRVSDAALAHLELDDLLQELVTLFTQIVDVDAAAVLLMEPDESHLRIGATCGLAEGLDLEALVPVGQGVLGRVAAEATTLSFDEVSDESVLDPALHAAGMRAALGVPMRIEGRVIGVITVAVRQERGFSAADRSLLELGADRASLAVEHARLYQRELDVVEVLQRSLLPEHLPRLPGIEIGARYMPGGAGADVGGDWYDAIPLDGGRIALALGDVVGHGIGAASLMGQLRNALRAYAVEGHGPADMMRRMDRLVHTLEQGRMATLLVMVFEPDLGTLRFSSAGHLPPFVLGPEGSAKYLEGARTPPLGVFAHGDYTEERAEITPGSTIVLYTDGLVEERGVPLDSGLDALERAAIDGPSDPDELCDHIIGELLGDRPATDDVAVLVLRTVPIGARHLELEFGTDPQMLRSLRAMLGRWLEGAGATPVEIHELQIACSEVTSNAIEHGHRFERGTVRLDAELNAGVLTMTISDSGSWREPRDSDRGRGLDLVRALTDSIEIEPSSAGTTVRMRRRLSVDGEGAAATASSSTKGSRQKKVASKKPASDGGSKKPPSDGPNSARRRRSRARGR
jgi:PAS domain S-box-containing protein